MCMFMDVCVTAGGLYVYLYVYIHVFMNLLSNATHLRDIYINYE